MGRRYTEHELKQLVRDAVREAIGPLQQRSAFVFIAEAVQAHFTRCSAPLLL